MRSPLGGTLLSRLGRGVAGLFVTGALLAAPAHAEDVEPRPPAEVDTEPRQPAEVDEAPRVPVEGDDAWLLQGWTSRIYGISGSGRTLLVVSGDVGMESFAESEGESRRQANVQVEGAGPALATFEWGDKDQRVALTVRDARGSEWSEVVDVPRGMKVTVELQARYLHRGYEGQVKNDRLRCRSAAARKALRFEIWQGEEQIGAAFTLDPGKSAPGIRLREGVYELRVSERRGRDFVPVRSVGLEAKASGWRHDEPCP